MYKQLKYVITIRTREERRKIEFKMFKYIQEVTKFTLVLEFNI